MLHIVLAFFAESAVVVSGALLHHGYQRVSKYRADKAFERRHPLSGDYLSKYEDEVDGKPTILKAPAKLVQKGRHVEGTTWFDNRTWILDGVITEDGYYLGRYYAENKYDHGLGNFFLKIDANDELHGMWSGYDSVNKRINCEHYTFVKMRDVSIIQATKEFLPRLLSIAEHELGDSYIQPESLLPKNGVTFLGQVNGDPVGYAACHIEPSENYIRGHAKIAQERIHALKAAKDIGVVTTVAVDSRFQGFGIGTKLLSESLNWLREHGVHLVAMVGWKSDSGVHIGGVAKSLGFESQFEIPEYWSEDSVSHGYKCPVCGDPPCHCTAVFFLKHL